VLSIAIAPSAEASELLVLKANGETIPNGALVNVATVEKPEFSFKTQITIEGTTTPVEEEIECGGYLEQGTIEHEAATGTWRVVNTHPVEVCEGTWLAEGTVENRLTLLSSGFAADETSLELRRSEEEVRAEERTQAEAGEPVKPREPLRCDYTDTANGKFVKSTRKPLLVKVKGKPALQPVAGGTGCGSKKTKLKAGFTMTYQGHPVFIAFETGP